MKIFFSVECGDEQVQEIIAISTLFEQTVLLIAQIFHSIYFYCMQNTLFTLIDNPSKIKEILKVPDMALDTANNMYLFGVKCPFLYKRWKRTFCNAKI